MIVLEGKKVFGGITIGPVAIYKRLSTTIERVSVADAEAEVARFHTAREAAQNQLKNLFEKALKEAGESSAAIFDVHQMMLEDLDYIESIEGIIRAQQVNAEYAVSATAENFAQMFASMDDAYMQARSADVRDISGRVLMLLSGHSGGEAHFTQPVVLVADDLVPSETVSLDKNMILGFVTSGGTTNSHTAILARTMGIPAVVSVGDFLDKVEDGMTIVVDGYTGKVYIDPDEETLQVMNAKLEEQKQFKKLLEELKGLPNETKSGKKIKVYANIGRPTDLPAVMHNDAGGIGLFRSEFLYIDKNDYPTEEEQFAAYKSVIETMGGKEVVIRTLDIGADKQVDYFDLPKEENPALGYRAIRICLTRPEIFKVQLRAILRASAFGKACIMFPMITSVQEVEDAKAILHEVMEELKAVNIAFDEHIQVGIMIETPAAALMTDELGKHVDFFSIGTNDLTQYTLAIDRQNSNLDRFFNAHHPALLRLIAMTAKNAHANGIWVGICGELGADMSLVQQFMEMGIDELSVSPAAILPLRKAIRGLE